ncbi:MAG: long-chain fatty acid--CoA ligase [Thermoleophilia bacterium]
MTTSPKLIAPFQVVRISGVDCRGPLIRGPRFHPFLAPAKLQLHVAEAAIETVRAPSASTGRRTIGGLWRDAVAAGRPVPPYLLETETGWQEVTWREAAARVDDLAHGFLALGVRKGDRVGILARTRLEWALCDFALALVGAVSVPVYPTSSTSDCAYILGHAEAIAVVCEDEQGKAKVEQSRERLPTLRHLLTFADLDSLAATGRAFAGAHPSALAQAEREVEDEDLYTILYTSGTTGPPKGCLIRHRNSYAMVASVAQLEGVVAEGDLMLLYLPLAHNFGRLMHLTGPYLGYTIAFCADPYRVADALLAVQPTVFPSVPRVYEKIQAAVVTGLKEVGGLKRRLVSWALDVGRRASSLRQQGRSLPLSLRLQHRICDRLVYSKVKAKLGGRLRVAISGGAPLAPEIAQLFHALDILILEGYGLTECTTAATVNRPTKFRFGTVGLPLPGFEVRLAEDGELLVRSETVFAGYYKDEEATRAVLDPEGWLRTGDIAEIDPDGFVRITDRKKDIIVTAGGKNVAPQNIENDLKASPYISQALVVGDRRPYLGALLTLDRDEVLAWARREGIDLAPEALHEHPRVQALVQGVVDRANRDRARFEQIKRFAILPRDFALEEGEVTPTLKLRRRVCEERFWAEIEALYR